MRKVLAVLSVFALATTVASAGVGVGIYGSYWDAGDFGAGYGPGFKVKVDAASIVALEIRSTYLPWFDPEDSRDADVMVVPVEADIVLQFPLADTLTIYGGGGVGYYVIPEFESKIAEGSSLEPDIDPEDVFGGFAVGGVEISLVENLTLFAEAVYRWVKVDEFNVDDRDIKLSDDETIDLTGFGANAGVMLKF
jgi:hypothetical protein